ncbi:MAG TPA: peptidoglycan DD-metalloendopeptidase family protein [Candidatus Dormibacteraeota bacterium]|nr:peptidoglycan DD-metalloendopeptidase family protein [Candidatus Dormibacteraeota bacterium]
MKRAVGALALAGALMVLQVSAVSATDPSPCPSPSSASAARVSCPAATPTPDPNQAAYDQLLTRLGGDLAKALTSEEQLTAALDQTSTSVQIVTDQITQEETVIANLQDQIAQLDTQIADTQARIDVEKEQVAAMAKAIYRQPNSLWLLVARTGNLHDALQATADLVIAGQRAHALQARLEADLLKLQADRAARQADLDRESATRDRLAASLNTLNDLMNTQSDISNQLSDVIAQIQDAQNGVHDQPPDVTAQLAALLESQEQDLIQRSYQLAWSAAHVGVGLALVTHMLPSGKTIAGLTLSWPMAGARVTQLFGPSDLLLEPPLGPYKHFHAGVDIAAPFGTTVMAAADGVVVAVGHSKVGYGNYVVIAHGGGIMTLYGHLLETDVNVGNAVARGQRVGLEGSTGWSTGPHVHFELRVNDSVVDPMPYLLKLAS